MAKDLIIRSNATEFLIFDNQIHKNGIEVRFEKGDLWLTQKAISELYDIDRTVVTKHLRNIFNDYELDKNSVCAIFAHTAKDNKIYKTNYYNLDAVISVGYRANSDRAIQFRRWATNILKEFAKRGYIIDKKRMEYGYNVTSADISKIALKKVKEFNNTIEIDMRRKLPFLDNSFKLVFANLSIHYFSDVVTKKLVQEIKRIILSLYVKSKKEVI